MWMELHGHTAAAAVIREFNGISNLGVWFRRTSSGGKKLTGKKLHDAEDLFKTELIELLGEKWRNEEEQLLNTLFAAILAAEVTLCTS